MLECLEELGDQWTERVLLNRDSTRDLDQYAKGFIAGLQQPQRIFEETYRELTQEEQELDDAAA